MVYVGWCYIFFAKLSIFTAMELDFGRLPYKTSLEPEKHEKQGPEVRYRIYLDDLDRFWQGLA